MHAIYNFVSGPLVWVAFIVFILGLAYRLYVLLSKTKQKEPFVFEFWSWKFALNSIFRWWILPFGSVNSRQQPVMTIVTWLFHVCLLITPLFLLAHVILFQEAWGVSWWTLPDTVADVMTWIVLAGCLYFLYRRLFLPQVKYVTYASDFILLAIVAAPFLTGFLAYWQLFNYQWMIILHILSGEIMLMAIPFTRLSHMVLAFYVRGYTASEFGAVRMTKDY